MTGTAKHMSEAQKMDAGSRGTFWGRRPKPEIRDKTESWKELKAHGGVIWKLKRNGDGWHGPDTMKQAEIKQTFETGAYCSGRLKIVYLY